VGDTEALNVPSHVQNGGTLDHEGAVAVAEHLVVLRPQLMPLTNAAICRNISAGQFMALIEVRHDAPACESRK